MRIFDRQDFLRVNRARARIKVLIDKVGIDAFREMVEEELEGDWVAERDFSLDEILFDHDEEANAPAPHETYATPNGDSREFSHFVESNVKRAAPAGFLDGRGQDQARRSRPEQLRGARTDHARVHRRLRPHDRPSEPRPSLGARRGGLRGVAAPRRARARRRRAPTRSPMSSAAPARIPASSGSRARWGSTQAIHERLVQMQIERRADPPDPHQDERLPERLRPASHRQHRLLRRLDQGRRAHGPGLHPAHRRCLRGRRRPLRPPAQGTASGQARTRSGRAVDTLLRVRAHRRRGIQRVRRPRRDAGVRGAGQGSDDADRVQPREHEPTSSTGARAHRSRSSAAKASARSDDRHRPARARGRLGRGGDRVRGRALPSAADDGLLLPEGGVGARAHADLGVPRRPRVHDRHRRAVPGDARDLEAVRGALRRARRGVRRVESRTRRGR